MDCQGIICKLANPFLEQCERVSFHRYKSFLNFYHDAFHLCNNIDDDDNGCGAFSSLSLSPSLSLLLTHKLTHTPTHTHRLTAIHTNTHTTSLSLLFGSLSCLIFCLKFFVYFHLLHFINSLTYCMFGCVF